MRGGIEETSRRRTTTITCKTENHSQRRRCQPPKTPLGPPGHNNNQLHAPAHNLNQHTPRDTGKGKMNPQIKRDPKVGTTAVPAFLAKLWKMVNDPSTASIISWADAGSTFVIEDQAKFTYQLLPAYYKHNNMSSFVRQLNMYGFHKTSNLKGNSMADEVEFHHPYFKRNMPEMLKFIRRKVNAPGEKKQEGGDEEVIKVLTDVRALKHKQKSVDEQLSAMKEENAILWRELALLRQKHEKQQQIVNKLIQFLVTIVRPSTRGMGGLGVKRQYPLMLKETNVKRKKTESEGTEGPIIHEVLQEDVLTDESPEFIQINGFENILQSDKPPEQLLDETSQDAVANNVFLHSDSGNVILSDLMNGNYMSNKDDKLKIIKRENKTISKIADLDSHVEATQSELENYKDLLQGCTSFDASALFGLFTDESPMFGLSSLVDEASGDPEDQLMYNSSQLKAYESGLDLSNLLNDKVDEELEQELLELSREESSLGIEDPLLTVKKEIRS